jgi:desampylase
MDLELTSGTMATLLKEATRAYPRECCGLLLGRGHRIERAVPTANVHPDPARHFEIDPAALIAAHKAARNGGPQLLGYYHSHPNGLAGPSPEDIASAERGGRIWAIIAHGDVLFWRDGPHGFEPLCSRVADG